MKDKIKKRDLLLIGSILVIAGLLLIGNKLMFNKPAKMVEITVDGKVVDTLDLKEDIETTVYSTGDGTNQLVIQDGKVFIKEASCPDGICVHQGKIHETGEMIVCLPNRMIAKIIGD